MNYKTSKKKQGLIDQFNKDPYKVGEKILVNRAIYRFGSERYEGGVIKKIIDSQTMEIDTVSNQLVVTTIDNIKKITRTIGSNPFSTTSRNIKTYQYSLASILCIITDRDDNFKYDELRGIRVSALNWNPYIIIDKQKKYYQRDFTWSLEDKRNLIESIYNDIKCGSIMFRRRDWDWVESEIKNGNNEVAFYDIVDGKQRLNAIISFMSDEFTDSYGNYYSDLSDSAQYKFGNHQLFSYIELTENTTDQETLAQFLKVNFAGVLQSKEHIEYIKNLSNHFPIEAEIVK